MSLKETPMPMPFAGTDRSDATAKKLCPPMLLFKRDHNVHVGNIFKTLKSYEHVIFDALVKGRHSGENRSPDKL